MWGAKLACYAVATVAFTFMLLRPRRVGGKRGSLFLGSGVVMVLIKTFLSVSDGSTSTAAPAPAPAAPVLAAATPAPARAKPQQPAAPVQRKRPANPAVASQPKAAPVTESATKKQPAAVAAVETAKPQAAVPAQEPAKAPTPAVARGSTPLGPRYTDKVGGFSVQFPTGWAPRSVKDACWILDASDGPAAISVGFSSFPAKTSVDEVVPEKLSRGYQKKAGTVVHATGYATVAGRRALWHKYTGPVTRPGSAARMTVVHYLLPLQDGRALELRVAASPEKFNEAAPRMKQSIDSFKLLTPVASAASARAR
jgi:hypothetical protein